MFCLIFFGLFLNSEGIASPPEKLKNIYFAIRHGQSTANVANIISSNPMVASRQHELTENGREQAVSAGVSLWKEMERLNADVDSLVLYSSNFTRARQTKEIIAYEIQRQRQLKTGIFDGPFCRIGLLENLRERDFGIHDGQNTGAYDLIWPRDLEDATSSVDGVESVASVCQRLSDMVQLLEKRHDNELIGLCSHADVCQIFQCWIAGCDIRTFSSYRYANGEVRRCDILGECLPEPIPMVSQSESAA